MPADPAVSVYIGTCEFHITRARVPGSATITSDSEIASFLDTAHYSNTIGVASGDFAREIVRPEDQENNYPNFYGVENCRRSHISTYQHFINKN